MRRPHTPALPLSAALAAGIVLALAGPARPQGPGEGPRPRVERLQTPEGRTIAGRLVVDAAAGFVLVPEGGGAPVPIERARAVTFEGPAPDRSRGAAPFRVLLGADGQVSGRLASLDEREIRLSEGPGGSPVTIARAGARALVQRPGEAQVFRDGFEALDDARWTAQVGDPGVAEAPRLVGERSLRLPAGGSAVTAPLAEPIGSGRLEVAYLDGGEVVPGQRWFVDLTFRNRDAGRATVRAVLGWAEETMAVESPGGPRLRVQRLLRRPGWHRLTVRFGPEETALAVDGDELAHGPGLGGPLVEVRLATEALGTAPAARGRAAHLDDLSLVRTSEPLGPLEVEPGLDEVRLPTGDQLFGRVAGADAERVEAEVDGRTIALPWSDVAGLYFRRAPAQSEPVEGPWARVEWAAGPDDDPRDLDRVEGALVGLSDDALSLEVPFVGRLAVPRDRLRRLVPLGPARRVVIDPTAHHLGDRHAPDLDPPQPEPGPLEVAFTLPEPPAGPAALALDVVQVVGEEGNSEFSGLVRQGHLRTHIYINDKRLDDLNRFIASPNETPERVRVPVPPGALRAGRNVVRLEQVGTPEEPARRDNLGVLGMALETPAGRAAGATQP